MYNFYQMIKLLLGKKYMLKSSYLKRHNLKNCTAKYASYYTCVFCFLVR